MVLRRALLNIRYAYLYMYTPIYIYTHTSIIYRNIRCRWCRGSCSGKPEPVVVRLGLRVRVNPNPDAVGHRRRSRVKGALQLLSNRHM